MLYEFCFDYKNSSVMYKFLSRSRIRLKNNVSLNNKQKMRYKNTILNETIQHKRFFTSSDNSPSFTSTFDSIKKDMNESKLNRTYSSHLDYNDHQFLSGDKRVNQYNKRLQELFRAGKIFQMFDLCDEMRQQNVKFNLHTYNWLLCAFEATKHPTKCIKVLDEMRENNIEPSTVSYSIVYKALAATQDISKAIKLYKEMISNNIKPTITIINSLLTVCQASNKSNIAINLMKDIVEFELKPTIETYCNLIECFCADTTENNESLLYWLKLANEEIKLMGKTIPTFIRDKVFIRFVNYNSIEGLKYLVNFNKEEKIPMEIGYLKRILETIARCDISLSDIEFAEEIYKLLEEMDAINQSILSVMLLIYGKLDTRKGFSYLSKIKKEFNYTLHPAVFDLLCEYLGFSEEKVDAGYFIIEEMHHQNEEVPIEAFNIVINNCAVIGDFNRAFGTYLEIKNFGLEPNEQTFTSLLNFTGSGDENYVRTVLEEAEKNNIILENVEEINQESKEKDGSVMMYGQEFK